MPRLFVEDYFYQLCKTGHRHCGDLWLVSRREEATWVILADGLGSGMPAKVSATLAAEYFLGLIENGFTPGEAIKAALRTLKTARAKGSSWAAFLATRLSPDGEVLVYCYESPPPLLLTLRGIELIGFRPQYWEGEVIQEGSTHLRPYEALLCFTDGVVNAGLSKALPRGWGENGLKKFLATSGLAKRGDIPRIPQAVIKEAAVVSQHRPLDDLTAGVIFLRQPRVLQVLTGPPGKKEHTVPVMDQFLKAEGTKAVCGGTTSSLLAKHLGVTPLLHPGEYGAPAYYEIPGIALACEGAITLNRAYNIIEEPELWEEAGHGAARLLKLFTEADEIYFWLGQAVNPAHNNTLKPAGILSRREIVAVLAEKLIQAGKMVSIRPT
jgi:hypothetical protein